MLQICLRPRSSRTPLEELNVPTDPIFKVSRIITAYNLTIIKPLNSPVFLFLVTDVNCKLPYFTSSHVRIDGDCLFHVAFSESVAESI